MAWAAAGRNIASTFAFQLRLSGDLAARLGYAGRYWAAYFRAKYVDGAARDELTSCALRRLAQSGAAQRIVQVRLGKLKLEIDQATCFIALKEIVGDGIYDLPGEDFAPRPGETVFDIGAQQGVFTALAAQRVGPGGAVAAFEPEPGNFERLRRNSEINGLAQVRALPLALADRAGQATLFRSVFNPGAHSLTAGEGQGEGVAVRVSTLDSAIAEEKLRQPNFIKLDVEGSTLAILRGGLETLRASRPRIALELDRLEDSSAVAGLLSPLGYRIETRGNNLFAW